MATLEQMYTPQAFSPQTTLSQDIGASDTRIYVASVNVFPTPPTLATIGTDAASAETVKITAKGTNYIDVQRGLLGTAKSWTTNSVIARNFSAADQTAIQNNINTLNATKLESVEADDVANNTLTNDKLAKVATNTLKGRRSANQGNVEDLTVAQVLSMLNVSSGADKTTAILEALLAIASYDEAIKLVVIDPTQAVGSQVKYLTIATLVSRLNDIYAAKSTTINAKSLANNITLTAADVGAQDKIDVMGVLANTSGGIVGYNFCINDPGENYDDSIPSITLVKDMLDNRALMLPHSYALNDMVKIGFDESSGMPRWEVAVKGSDYVAPPASATVLPTSGEALTANTMYNVSSAVTTYNFVSPSSNGWAHGIFIAGTSPNITFRGTIIGQLPTFEANKKYEFDVLANTWIVQEIVSQS